MRCQHLLPHSTAVRSLPSILAGRHARTVGRRSHAGHCTAPHNLGAATCLASSCSSASASGGSMSAKLLPIRWLCTRSCKALAACFAAAGIGSSWQNIVTRERSSSGAAASAGSSRPALEAAAVPEPPSMAAKPGQAAVQAQTKGLGWAGAGCANPRAAAAKPRELLPSLRAAQQLLAPENQTGRVHVLVSVEVQADSSSTRGIDWGCRMLKGVDKGWDMGTRSAQHAWHAAGSYSRCYPVGLQ